MKTAEQWLEEMKLRPCVTESDLLIIIRRIQRDAQDRDEWLSQALNEGDGSYKP